MDLIILLTIYVETEEGREVFYKCKMCLWKETLGSSKLTQSSVITSNYNLLKLNLQNGNKITSVSDKAVLFSDIYFAVSIFFVVFCLFVLICFFET